MLKIFVEAFAVLVSFQFIREVDRAFGQVRVLRRIYSNSLVLIIFWVQDDH